MNTLDGMLVLYGPTCWPTPSSMTWSRPPTNALPGPNASE